LVILLISRRIVKPDQEAASESGVVVPFALNSGVPAPAQGTACDALVVGDSVSMDFDRRMFFGVSKKLAGRPGAFKAVRAGFLRAVQIGPVQSISVGWGFGG
jgi:hypothetical protein